MLTERNLAIFLAALAINELLHIAFEIWGARQKVRWLTARLDKQPHGGWPVHIDSFAKTIVLHVLLYVFIVGLSAALFAILNLSVKVMLLAAITLLIITYAYTVVRMDAFHNEISLLLRRYKRH